MKIITWAMLAAIPLAVAQNTGTGAQDFYREAAESNLAEVEMGRLAAQKATSPEVKAFAQQMVTDHTKATTDLQQIAQRKGIMLPTEPGMRHRTAKQSLDALSGTAFEKAYLEAQVRDHERSVMMLEKQMKGGGDSDATALATKLLPVVQQHQRTVEKLAGGKSAAHSADHPAGAGPGGRHGAPGMDSGGSEPGTSNSTTGNSTVTPSDTGSR